MANCADGIWRRTAGSGRVAAWLGVACAAGLGVMSGAGFGAREAWGQVVGGGVARDGGDAALDAARGALRVRRVVESGVVLPRVEEGVWRDFVADVGVWADEGEEKGEDGLPRAFEVRVRVGNGDEKAEDVTLRLSRVSVRDAGFSVVADDERVGGGVKVGVPPVLTYRGTVVEWPGSAVAVGLTPEGLRGMIRRWRGGDAGGGEGGGEIYGIEPLGAVVGGAGGGVEGVDAAWDGVGATRHVTYAARDIVHGGERCGVIDAGDEELGAALGLTSAEVALARLAGVDGGVGGLGGGLLGDATDGPGFGEQGAGGGGAGGGGGGSDPRPRGFAGYGQRGSANWRVAQIAFDADNLFFQQNGSSINATTADIEFIVNGMSLIYERDAEITYAITTVRVRSAPGFDPYSATLSANSLLTEFRTHWNNEETGTTRDMAHLMTGRNLEGDTIGLAFTGVVCGNAAYGLSQSRYTSNSVSRIALTAHEAGHNWSSPHCDGEIGCGIMCATIGNCSGTSFGAWELERIEAHRDSRSCLSLVAARPGQVANVAPANNATRVVSNGAGGNGVVLSWNAASLATSYRVFLGTGSGALTQVGTATGTSFTTAALEPATRYRWRVDAVNAGGVTAGIEWAFTTEFGPLACGADFTGDCVSDLVWWNATNGQVEAWRGLGDGRFASSVVALATVSDLAWRVVGTGDFDGNNTGDILWRNTSTGDVAVWRMDLGEVIQSVGIARVADQAWVVGGVGDFTGDGRSDIVWHNTRTGDSSIWEMAGVAYVRAIGLPRVADRNWQLTGVGGLGGTAGPDLVWRNARTGATAVWLMNGAAYAAAADVSPSAPAADVNWQVIAVMDVDGDGRADLVWRNALTGAVETWRMNGVARAGVVANATRADPWRGQGQRVWRTLVAGDIDGDATRDIAWRNAGLGASVVWRMVPRGTVNDPFVVGATVELPVVDGSWELAGTGDFNRDNMLDLVWRRPSNGQVILWLMNGGQVGAAIPFLSSGTTNWLLAGVADINRDERDDMVWTNTVTGSAFAWLLDGTPAPGSYLVGSRNLPTVPTGSRIEGVADFTGDGRPDLVLRTLASGALTVWEMNEAVFVRAVALPTVDPEWTVGTVGDFNDDGKADIGWRNTRTGENAVWLMDGTTFVVGVALPGVDDQGWRMVR